MELAPANIREPHNVSRYIPNLPGDPAVYDRAKTGVLGVCVCLALGCQWSGRPRCPGRWCATSGARQLNVGGLSDRYLSTLTQISAVQGQRASANKFEKAPMDLPRFRGEVSVWDQGSGFGGNVSSFSCFLGPSFGSAESIFSSRPARTWSRRAQGRSRLAVAPTWPAIRAAVPTTGTTSPRDCK